MVSFKSFNLKDQILFSIAVLLLLLSTTLLVDESWLMSFDQNGTPPIGSIEQTDSNVRKKIKNQFGWIPALENDPIRTGDSIFSGEESEAVVQLADGSRIKVQPNSLIVFKQSNGKLALDLKYGQAETFIAPGSDLQVQSSCDPTLNLDCNLQLGSADRNIASLSELTWKDPLQLNWKHFNYHQPLTLEWSKDVRAARYRVQIASDSQFKQIVTSLTTKRSKLSTMNYPENGVFFIRVLAEGDDRKVLNSTTSEKFFVENVQAPEITTPGPRLALNLIKDRDGEYSPSNQPIIQWNYSLPQNEFEIQWAKDENFKDIIATKIQKGPINKSPPLSSGTTYVRVRDATFHVGAKKPWSKVSKITTSIQEISPFAAPVLANLSIQQRIPNPQPAIVSWSPVPEAAGYLVEVSRDPEFRTTTQQTIKKTSISLDDRFAGKNYVRVSAVTGKGSKGLSSSVALVELSPDRPILDTIQPKILLGKSPEDLGGPTEMPLSWTQSPYAKKYEVEFDVHPDFKNPIRVETASNSKNVSVPAPGKYYWRVRPKDVRGLALTEYSDVGRFDYFIKKPLRTPRLIEPGHEVTLYFQKKNLNSRFWLSWAVVKNATHYVLEVTRDAKFESGIVELKTGEPRLLWPENYPEGKYFWRVKAEGDLGQVSNWSEIREFDYFAGPLQRRIGALDGSQSF